MVEYTAETDRLVAEAETAWTRLKKSQAWDDWKCIGFAIDSARRDILRACASNDRSNQRVRDSMGDWLRQKRFSEIDKGVRSRLQDCIDHECPHAHSPSMLRNNRIINRVYRKRNVIGLGDERPRIGGLEC